MSVPVLLGISLAGLVFAFGIIFEQWYALAKHKRSVDESYDGHEQLKRAIFAVLRIVLRRLAYFRRILFAYGLHLAVQILSLFDKLSFYLYSKSRNFFVESALKSKGTVPHFWDHLKRYKQEMDREREKLEGGE